MFDPANTRHAFEFATRHAVCLAVGVRDGHQLPLGLQSALSTCLNSAAAMQVWWGHQLLVVENEASAQLRSVSQSVSGLRGPALKIFASVWPAMQSAVDRAFLRGVGGTVFGVTLGTGLNSAAKSRIVAFLLQPIFSDAGTEVEGILCTLMPEVAARNEREARADYSNAEQSCTALAS